MKTNNQTLKLFLFSIAAISIAACAPQNFVSLEEVSTALETAQPGDTIYVKDGLYQDLSLVWEGRGSEDNPIVVLPQSKGGVIITGASQLRICGHDLTVSSLVFKDGTAPSKNVVDFKNGDDLAQRCRLTDCVIDSYNPVRRDIQCTLVGAGCNQVFNTASRRHHILCRSRRHNRPCMQLCLHTSAAGSSCQIHHEEIV